MKFEFKTNVVKLNPEKYKPEIFSNCTSDINPDKDDEMYICKTCDRSLLKGKMPPQAQKNGLTLNKVFKEIENLCPLELSLISQIIPFMFIVARHKGAQHGLKGQVILVPSDLTKIQKVLPRSCDEGHLISLALK